MKLIEFKTVSQDGRKATILVNPERVCYIVPIVVPGELSGPDGEKMGKVACALDFGGAMLPEFLIPVECSREEAARKLMDLDTTEFLKWKNENMNQEEEKDKGDNTNLIKD